MNCRYGVIIWLILFSGCALTQTEDRFLVQISPLAHALPPNARQIQISYSFHCPESTMSKVAFIRITDSRKTPYYYSNYDSGGMAPALVEVGRRLGADRIVIGKTHVQRRVVSPSGSEYDVASVDAFAISCGRVETSPLEPMQEKERAVKWYDTTMDSAMQRTHRALFLEELEDAIERRRNPEWMFGWGLTNTRKAYQLEWVEGRFFAHEVDSTIATSFGFQRDKYRALLDRAFIESRRRKSK